MSLVWADRVHQLSNTSGTGNLTLGTVPLDEQAFASVMSTGDTCYGYAASQTTTNMWEINLFTLQSDGTLARASGTVGGVVYPLASSNGGALVVFDGSTLDVRLDVPAYVVAQMVLKNQANVFTAAPQTVVSGTQTITIGGVGSYDGFSVLDTATLTYGLGVDPVTGGMTVTCTASAGNNIVVSDSNTSGQVVACDFHHILASGTAANGCGVSFRFFAPTDTHPAGRQVASWVSQWTTITDGSRASQTDFKAGDHASLRTAMSIGANGSAALFGAYGVIPVVQPSTTGTTAGFTGGAGSPVDSAATFTGGTGSTAYTIDDIVLALKQLGFLAS